MVKCYIYHINLPYAPYHYSTPVPTGSIPLLDRVRIEPKLFLTAAAVATLSSLDGPVTLLPIVIPSLDSAGSYKVRGEPFVEALIKIAACTSRVIPEGSGDVEQVCESRADRRYRKMASESRRKKRNTEAVLFIR
eukprot:SAG31_NODE_9001_length_1349_cov_2.584000_1_plen_135_part_00